MTQDCAPSTSPEIESLPVLIELSADSSEWFKQLLAAVAARPGEIRVHFTGGSDAPPCELIALTNYLKEVPSEIRLVTVAMGSLPSFACVPWMVGEERWIARDALVWIPDLPEEFLRSGTRGKLGYFSRKRQRSEGAEQDRWVDGKSGEAESGASRRRRDFSTMRLEGDLQILADAVNEWFPSWEFRGKPLRFDDLVEWGVVDARWVVGKGRRQIRRVVVDSFGVRVEGEVAVAEGEKFERAESPEKGGVGGPAGSAPAGGGEAGSLE